MPAHIQHDLFPQMARSSAFDDVELPVDVVCSIESLQTGQL